MKTLIVKLGATGDVVRTTTLLNVLEGEIHWLTSDENAILFNGNSKIKKCVKWNERNRLKGTTYDLVINLEDSVETTRVLREIEYKELFGSYLNDSDRVTYTESAKEWFDLSIISRFGKEAADELKLKNRKTYQELIFKGLGFTFQGERYFLPDPAETDLVGDIAIAPKSGAVWPMKNWAYFGELKDKLDKDGYQVNYLPMRESMLEHFGDIKNHDYLISGDSLPMHIALGYGIKCTTIFICTSPWEIHDYGVQRKLVSPDLEEYFYRRDFEEKAVTSITLDEVYQTVLQDKIGE